MYARARPDLQGEITVWDVQTRQSSHIPISDPDAVAAAAAERVKNGYDAYWGVCPTKPGLGSGLRGTKFDVVALLGFWMDVDILGPGHAGKDLPNEPEAYEIIDSCPLPATIVVHSGRGLHAYWLFEQPWILASGDHEKANNASKAFQKTMIDYAKTRGWKIDQTGNIDRVLRLPDTFNFKISGDTRPVKVLVDDGPHHPLTIAVSLQSRPTLSVAQAQAQATAVQPTSPTSPNAPKIKPDLNDIKKRLRNLKNMGNKRLMLEVIAGRPFATPGGRDEALQKVASVIAFISPPNTDPVELAEILRPSLDTMAALSNDPTNPALTFEDAVEKLGRALSDAERKHSADVAERAQLLQKFSSPPVAAAQGEGHASPSTAAAGGAGIIYSDDDVRRFAVSQDCTLEKFKQRWIIQHATAYYVFVDGVYKYPVPKDALVTKLRDDLAPAEPLGIRLWTLKTDGGSRSMTVQEIMNTYGVVARQARGSLTLDKSFYDPEAEIFWEALCPPRKIDPAYHEQVDTWLRLLGNTQAESLLDWIATIGQLEDQTSALYLSGKAGAGKTLLAHGLARLWTDGGPTELGDVVGGNFNSGIGRCPLVFGDEDIKCSTADLRRLVGSSAHTLKRKYLPNMDLVGSLRVILADNSGRMLIQTGEELGLDDIDAVASKFLHIAVDDAPVDYLKSLGGRVGTDDWVTGDKVAAHALWLRDNRVVKSGGRFVVSGAADSMNRLLASQNKVSGLVCEWVMGFAENPIVNIIQQKTAMVGGGLVLVNVDAISQHWGQYIFSERNAFSKSRIGRALHNLSKGTKRVGSRRYHEIDMSLVFEWAKENLIGDLTAIQTKIDTPFASTIQVLEDAAQ
jgi:hypothetical protein